MTRKVAVNRVIKGDVSINRCIVEIENGFVVDYYHFDDEQPFTEWLGGTIEIITSFSASFCNNNGFLIKQLKTYNEALVSNKSFLIITYYLLRHLCRLYQVALAFFYDVLMILY